MDSHIASTFWKKVGDYSTSSKKVDLTVNFSSCIFSTDIFYRAVLVEDWQAFGSFEAWNVGQHNPCLKQRQYTQSLNLEFAYFTCLNWTCRLQRVLEQVIKLLVCFVFTCKLVYQPGLKVKAHGVSFEMCSPGWECLSSAYLKVWR